MARLSEIEIRESPLTYTNQRSWSFHRTGHHVRELLRYHLGRGYELDGSAKFSVIFGPRPENEKPLNTVLGVTWCYIEDFDVEDYMLRPVEVQQESILTELTKALLEAANTVGSDTAAITDAANAVRESGFAEEITIDKLARTTEDRKLRVRVYRCLGPRVGEYWEAKVFDSDNAVLGNEPMTACPHYLNYTDRFSKSTIGEALYQITSNRTGAIEYTLNLSPYLDNR
ncbi:hypothetical protein [Aeoliella mucimassa]|uniref:Uncharacterized protein n=1 Tax=Aeoliella mucimassa TaxID=2527972 RepID=A0A518ARN3_9BACT|nr:hypothetical protein [Aeoliella mucimassa]QDU57371.1 hypothetical protein Pan181_35860 [Aeoliella mucimassa]